MSVTSSLLTRTKLIDVIITFDSQLPHFLLSPFATRIIHFPLSTPTREASWLDNNKQLQSLLQSDLLIVTTDSEQMRFSKNKTSTIYAPVVSFPPIMLSPSGGQGKKRLLLESPRYSVDDLTNDRIGRLLSPIRRPYFVSFSWYSNTRQISTAIEAFSIFRNSHLPPPGEFSDEELSAPLGGDGCTGSGSGGQQLLPCLVVLGVKSDEYLLFLREINRLKLSEIDDVIILLGDTGVSTKTTAEIIDHSIGVIHTPSEVNEIRIPCAAMLSSRPVITTLSFCQSEPVRHESTGILVKTGSPHLVAQAIDQIYNMYSTRNIEWQRMGLRGKQRVVTEFSVEMFGSRLDDVIEGQQPPVNAIGQRTRSLSASGGGGGSTSGNRVISVQSGLNELGHH